MTQRSAPDQRHLKHERWRLLRHWSAFTDKPLIVLSFVWLGLLVLDFTTGLDPMLQALSYLIWAVFIVDFLVEFAIAPRKKVYLQKHWLTALALVLPAFRVLRVVPALRALQAARAARTVGLLRVVTSLNRGMGALGHTLQRRGIGYLIALTVIVIFVGAAGMQFFENPAALREAGYTTAARQSAGLQSYGEAVWWTTMLMTTLGSDYWPQTVAGRVLCGLLSLYAFAIFGYITATIAGHFVGQETSAQVDKAATEAASGAASGTGASAELRALREEIAALRAQMAALAPSRHHTAPQSSRDADLDAEWRRAPPAPAADRR
jgi:voltage-gated potassium channel